MNLITCPKCGGHLQQVIWAGVEVDRCLCCKGIWFDSLEAETLKAVKGSENLDIGDPNMGSQLDQLTDELDCPRCDVKLIRMVDIDRHCIWYEQCPACYGVWLDAGEFRDFKENFKPKGILHKARNVFSKKRK